MQSPIQLITSAILHLYAYIQRLFFYISTVTRPSRLAHSNDTPFLYDSGMSLNDLERGLQDLQPTTHSRQDRCQSVMDISCANSKVSTNVSRPSSTTECEPHISHFVKHRDTLDSTRRSDALRRRSYSLSCFSPPEPRIHQRKRSSTVWFKKPATTGDYKRFSDYDDGDDTNVVARVRRAIEECAEEEDVRAIFDRRSAWDTIKSVVIDEDAILEETEDSFSMYSSSVPSTPVPPSQSESTQGLEFAKTSDTSELAYTNQDSAMVSSVSTFVTGFPTYKSLDKVLAALALQSTGAEVSWSDLVSFSEDNRVEVLEEGKVVSHANGFESTRSDVPWLLSLEPYDG